MQTTPNSIKHRLALARAAIALVVAGILASALWRVVADAGHAVASGAPQRAEDVLVMVAASGALAAVGWLAVGVLLELGSLVPGALGRGFTRVADVVTPRMVRRTAGALLGIGLVAGLAPGAAVAAPLTTAVADSPLPDPGFDPLPDPGWVLAVPAPAPPTGARPTATPGSGWVPSAPVVRAQPDVRVLSPAPRSAAGDDRPEEVVVHRGDSLWTIVARHLGHDSSDAEIARAWPAWYEANRAVIGDDPDVLHPGQVLRPPQEVRS
jgi:hypothetical protein